MTKRLNILLKKNAGIEGLVTAEAWIAKSFDPKLLELVKVRVSQMNGCAAVSTVTAAYLLVFVGIAQAFLKVPALRAAAPTSTEAPFAVTQLVVLVAFAALAVAAAKLFRPAPARRAYA